MNISLTIASTTDLNQLKEIIPLPFMVGCKWCPTSVNNHDPIRNHQYGENAVDLRGYVLLSSDKGGCAPKYFFAHEKIAHNNISTVENDKGVFMTTLKTQDSRNNSVETRLYKKKVDGQADVYYVETTCFKEPLRVNDLFHDIFETLNGLAAESSITNECNLISLDYDIFIEKIMLSVAGEKLVNYIIYDFSYNKTTAFDLTIETPGDSKKPTLESRTKGLFRETNNRVQYYTENFKSFYSTERFKEFMINAIFPSIAPLVTNSVKSRYNAYIGKAILLMRILIWNILTESQILEPTDRNDIGRKVYMAIDQIIRRDITRDNGAILDQKSDSSPSSKIDYSPKTASSKGETNVIETFDMTNVFNSIAQLTSVNTPRSSHSKRMGPRDVNFSQTGYICPAETPSTDKVGLVTHMACTAAFSAYKDQLIVEDIVKKYIDSDSDRVFSSIFEIDISEIEGLEDYVEHNAKPQADKKLLSINSIPYTMITEKQYHEIRKAIKRNISTMDVVVLKESIKVNRSGRKTEDSNKVITLSYNIICDSGRIYRPLYRVDRLVELGLLEGTGTPNDKLEEYHKRFHNFEHFIKQGIVELVFPSEMDNYTVAESRKNLFEAFKQGTHTSYEYCELDPYVIFGVVSACSPMFNHNPGNRALHQSAMDKSLLSIINSNQNMISETSAKKLHTTSQPVVTTKPNEFYSRFIKNGENAIMGINIGTHNQEDAIMVQESFAKSIVSERISYHEFIIEAQKEFGGVPIEQRMKSEIAKNPRYHAIDLATGAPRVRSILKEGDVIFIKYIEQTSNDADTGETISMFVPKPIMVQTGKDGYVSKVTITQANGQTVVQVMLATMKTIDYGDKLSSRYSQKSVVGGIIKDNDMLYVDDPSSPLHGTTLNLLFSPMSITSRGTAGLLLEMMLGNLGVATGDAQDATAFTVNRDRMLQVNDQLMKSGFKPWCVERVYNPITKTHMYTMVGVVHIRVLKHTAVDKQKACGMLNYRQDLMTRQPAKGGPTGGSRLGYMDSNTLFGQNAAKLVNLLYKDQSNEVIVNICENCHHLNDRCNRDPATALDINSMDHCTRCGERALREVSTVYSLVMIHNYLLSVGVKLDLFAT